MKKHLFLTLIFLIVGGGAFSQTHYMTVRVDIKFKNNTVKHLMNAEIGTEAGHPLKGKIVHVEETGSIKIDEGNSNFIVLNSETDMLFYFDNHGWDLVSVNEIYVMENKLLQYLFKSE